MTVHVFLLIFVYSESCERDQTVLCVSLSLTVGVLLPLSILSRFIHKGPLPKVRGSIATIVACFPIIFIRPRLHRRTNFRSIPAATRLLFITKIPFQHRSWWITLFLSSGSRSFLISSIAIWRNFDAQYWLAVRLWWWGEAKRSFGRPWLRRAPGNAGTVLRLRWVGVVLGEWTWNEAGIYSNAQTKLEITTFMWTRVCLSNSNL
jgi:hypothetical protein